MVLFLALILTVSSRAEDQFVAIRNVACFEKMNSLMNLPRDVASEAPLSIKENGEIYISRPDQVVLPKNSSGKDLTILYKMKVPMGGSFVTETNKFVVKRTEDRLLSATREFDMKSQLAAVHKWKRLEQPPLLKSQTWSFDYVSGQCVANQSVIRQIDPKTSKEVVVVEFDRKLCETLVPVAVDISYRHGDPKTFKASKKDFDQRVAQLKAEGKSFRRDAKGNEQILQTCVENIPEEQRRSPVIYRTSTPVKRSSHK